ncbi:MAG: hypothetical protein J5771_05450 [Bacteroidales bacterium]|nr:hypothetical protein [Bacteroidales bacterium]
MKARYFVLLAAMALLASCAKEEKAPLAIEKGTTVLQVGIASETAQPALASKTYMGEKDSQNHRKVYWSNGDQISVNGVASAALAGLEPKAASVKFTFEGVLNTPYKLLYPSSIRHGDYYVDLPAVQEYKDTTFADGMFPMAGYSEDGQNIVMHHLCALLKISILQAATDADTDDIVAVRFKGRNNEQVSGTFEISYDGHSLGAATGSDGDLQVKVVHRQATSTSKAVDYYIVIPARAYSDGFDVTVQDAKGHIMTKSKSGYQFPEAGHLLTMAPFEFVPTGTELGVEISSAADLVKFAKDYNDGKYAGQEDLVATLTQNITFDASSSAAFNTEGGIGSAYGGSNYFKGVFNGNSKTISGLVATVPLFGGIDESSTVKDFSISGGSFTFTRAAATGNLYCGAIAGYHKGLLSGVTVSSNVALGAKSDVEGDTAFGGLVGRLASTGTIDGCTYSGHLSTPSGYVTKTNAVNILVGGLAGYSQSTTTCVKNSHMQGTIDHAAVTTAPTANNTTPFLMLGGIIGKNAGSITNCDTACLDDSEDGAISYTASDGNSYYATIVNHAGQIHCLAEGGIVGYNYNGAVVSGCTNNAKIITNVVADADLKARYFRIGGIAGMNMSATSGTTKVTGCNNYGEVINSSSPRLQSSGGIVGWNSAEVSSCTNYPAGKLSFITAGTGNTDVRNAYAGGVIGENSGSGISDVHNEADLEVLAVENNVTNYGVRLGGVVGSTSAALNGGETTKNITNTGKVYASFGVFGASTSGINIGGIAGYSSASVSYAVNKGYVLFYGTSGTTVMKYIYVGGVVGNMDASGSITGCSNEHTATANSGEVYFYFDNNVTKHSLNYAGGILGYSKKGVNISGCTNNGYIHGGNGGTNKGSATCFVGGIVAYLEGTGSAISSCVNNGNINNHQRNNTYDTKSNSTYTGGIAGEVIGTSDNRVSISNCTVSPTDYVISHRGYVGGVVGYAEYADISSCSHNKNFDDATTSSAYFVGGVAGWLVNCNLTSCTWSGTSVDTSQLQANGAGGIASKMDGGKLDGCSSYMTSIKKGGAAVAGGALIGVASNTPTVINCHYKASINGAASSIASSGDLSASSTGNVADL